MAWGLGGYSGGYREPAPKRLTLEELLGLDYSPAPPPHPAPVTNLRDLQGNDRRQAQQDSLWAGLAALGANLSGDRRGAMAGLGDIQQAQDRALAGANARQEAEWQAENERRAAEGAQAKKRQEASALYGMYARAVEGEDPAGPYARRAEVAARAGSMAEVEKLADPEVKAKRAFVRSKGGNPDVYEDMLRKQEELTALLEQEKAASAWEGEKKRLEEKERVTAEAETAKRVAQRDAGVLWEPPQYEPLDRIAARTELVESIRDRHESTRAGGVAGKIGKVGETWGWLSPPDKDHPKGSFAPLDGQPQSAGQYLYFTVDGQRYVQDKSKPGLGAFPVELHEEGVLPGAPGAPATKPAAPAGPGVLDRIGAAARNAFAFPGSAPAPKKPTGAAPKGKPAPTPASPAVKMPPLALPPPGQAPRNTAEAQSASEARDVALMLRDFRSDPQTAADAGLPPGTTPEDAARAIMLRAGRTPQEIDALLRAAGKISVPAPRRRR